MKRVLSKGAGSGALALRNGVLYRGTPDGTVRRLEIASRRELPALDVGYDTPISMLAVDAHRVYAAGDNTDVEGIDVRTGKRRCSLNAYGFPVFVHCVDKSVLVGCGYGAIDRYTSDRARPVTTVSNGSSRTEPKPRTYKVDNRLAGGTSNGTVLLTYASAGRTVSMWSIPSGQRLRRLKTTGTVAALAIGSDLALALVEHEILVWRGPKYAVTAHEVSPARALVTTGEHAYVGGQSGLAVLDLATGRVRPLLDEPVLAVVLGERVVVVETGTRVVEIEAD